MKTILFLLSISISFIGFNQLNDTHYFNDTLNGKLNQIHNHIEVEDGIIISGEINMNNKEYPVVIKISPQGELIWSTINSLMVATQYNCLVFNISLFKDGYLYGVTSFDNVPNKNRMWKIDPQNGTVIYSKVFYSDEYSSIKLVEYDSSKYIATYEIETAGVQYAKFAYMNKATGDTLSTKTMGATAHNREGARVDANKNVYFFYENKFMKFNKGNLNQKLWEKTYQSSIANPLDIIHDIYLDQEDRIFLFGIDGGTFGHGDGNVLEVSPLDGAKLWDTQASPFQVRKTSLVDRGGKLYISYQHSTVGGSIASYFASRIDKSSGQRDWYCQHYIDEVGSPIPSLSGDMEAPLSMDLDCQNGLYMTGYYGDSGYGPGNWGVMKVDANTGAKLYDFTITEDSTYFDEYAVGRVMCLFENTPVVLGHIENLASPNFWKSDAYYVAFDPQNGTILNRHGINGQFQIQPKTIDLVRKDSIMYVLKQQGKFLAVQSMNSDFSANWSCLLTDTSYIHGGQLTITPNYIYVTAHMNNSTGFYPFDNGVAYRYYIYRINRLTGALTHSDHVQLSSGTIAPMEIEADDNQCYFFYRRNANEYAHRWNTTSGFMGESAMNLAGSSLDFLGEHNNVINYSSTSLIVIGADAIRLVPKSNLFSSSVLFSFSGARSYYDNRLVGNKLYMAGKTNTGLKLITVYDILGDSIVWEETYGPGSCLKIDKDPYHNFIVGCERDSVMSAMMVKRLDGSLIWEQYIDSIAHPQTKLMDCKVNKAANIIALTGASYNSNGSTDAFISTFNFYGDTLFTYLAQDVQDIKSTGFTIEAAPDSTTWIGGAHNRLITVKEGFIFSIGTNYCERFITGDSVSCSNSNSLLTAWSGTNYQWYKDGLLLPGEVNQTYAPTADGIYNVSVTDDCSQDSLIYGFNYVQSFPSTVLINGNGIFCMGDSVLISTPTPLSYQWYLNGNLLTNATSNSFYATTAGNYNVMVTNAIGCADSAAVGIVVTTFPIQVLNFELASEMICVTGAPISLIATPAGGSFNGTGVTMNQFDPVSTGLGTYYITYTFTDNNNCVSSIEDTIQVSDQIDSVLTINAINTYTLNGQTYTTSGTYQQIIPNGNGCDTTITLILTVNYTGIEEIEEVISIHPNPSSGQFSLHFISIPTSPIAIYDSRGCLIKTQAVNSSIETIDLVGKAPGVYFLHVAERVYRLVIED